MRLDVKYVDGLCAAVDATAVRPRIDLSGVTFVEPYGLVYLGMFIRHNNSLGKMFTIIPPRSRQVTAYLNSQRFWERFNISVARSDREGRSGMARFTSLRDIIDIENNQYIAEDVGKMVYDILTKNAIAVQVDLVTELVIELVDNFSRHSGQHVGACAMQLYPNANRLDFAVGDCGVGIRASLARNPAYEHLVNASHQEAAVKAMEDGVTGGAEGGTGFGTVRENVLELGGRMFLSTGDGWILVEGTTGDIQSGRMDSQLPGVQIEISLPVGAPR